MIDLNTLSLNTLASLYNLVAEKSVNKFKDKATGVRKLGELLDSRMEEVFICSGDGEEPVEYDIRPVAGDGDDTTTPIKVVPVADGVDAEGAGGKRGRKSKLTGRALELVREKNPKRDGSRTKIRYEVYREVTSSDDFIRLCEERGLGTRREILSDLDYDSKQQFIKLI